MPRSSCKNVGCKDVGCNNATNNLVYIYIIPCYLLQNYKYHYCRKRAAVLHFVQLCFQIFLLYLPLRDQWRRVTFLTTGVEVHLNKNLPTNKIDGGLLFHLLIDDFSDKLRIYR